MNPQRTAWSARKRKTEHKRRRGITKENPRAIRLKKISAHGNRKNVLEDILGGYHDIFARHRVEIGMNLEVIVRLTPKAEETVYSQSLLRPIHLKEDFIVEFSLMHKHGIITVLQFSKYPSPNFAHRKPNGKLRLFVDLRRINTLIADEKTNSNHPVRTFWDAAQHWVGKSLFCKLDCSQDYNCFVDGGPTVSGSACILFLQQNPCLQETCKRT